MIKKWMGVPFAWIVAGVFSSSQFAAHVCRADDVDFNFHVRPILSDRCYTCHGPDEENRQGGFRLDERESAVGEADSGAFPIVPGDAGASEIIARITSTDPDVQMPPPETKLSLSSAEIETLRQWIDQGAPWKKHWSFLSLENVDVPDHGGNDWPHNEIDHFVWNALQQHDLQPAAEADRETLIRRLTYDLTGLPPTVAEMDAFVADHSADAYERLVDRLLASTRYGERMAVDWLDLARYADTYGYQEDRYRETWVWRDWVVKAFNRNMPYDEFITWQIAGDLLPDATDEQILATAFNRLHRQTSEGGSVEEEFRTEYVVDRVDTFGAAFLGLTIGCARCHDHKYDPITQKDYYQLFAFFNNIDECGLYPYFTSSMNTPTLTLASEQQKQNLHQLQQAVGRAEAALERVPSEQRVAFANWLQDQPEHLSMSGLIGDFSMDEIEGSKVANRADREHGGNLNENPQVVTGKVGTGLLLDGEDNFNTKVGGLFTRFDPFTISLWVNTPDLKDRAVIWHRSRATIDAGDRGYQLLIEDGKISASLVHFYPGNAIHIRTQQTLPVDQWVQVTVTYDGSSQAAGLKIYWNGEPQACQFDRDCLTRRVIYSKEANAVDQDKVASIAHQLVLGQRFRDRGFKGGRVDELKVFDRELSALEVADLASAENLVERLFDQRDQRTTEENDQLYAYYLHNHNAEFASKLEAVRVARQAQGRALDAISELMVMRELPERRPTFLLARGAYDAPTYQVYAQTPASLSEMNDDLPRNRLGLAQWLTDPSHPLTARVAVNRLWQSLFGQGFVTTPLDFGSQGTLPTNPALLDWLSQSFIDSGWDIKQLLKLMVMSATYRQSSDCTPDLRARDPLNGLLARGPRHRLSAEMIRDSALYHSGLLVEKMGGPPVKPYQPPGLWKEKGSAVFTRDKNEGSRRRSLYTYWKRTSPSPAMMTLDAAKRDICVVQRQTTATPLQSLVLLNDPQYVEASRAMAEKVMGGKKGDVPDQITLAFRQLTSRAPNSDELEILEKLHEEQLAYFTAEPESAQQFLEIGDHRKQDESDATQLAALTVVVEAIMNLSEAITKP